MTEQRTRERLADAMAEADRCPFTGEPCDGECGQEPACQELAELFDDVGAGPEGRK